ncbi:MAG: spore germination protein [Clostridiales bacterium]|nr:spore germination protein [Clostridiales bacterium]
MFKDDDTFITRKFNNKADSGIRFCIFYEDGMVNQDVINDHIIKPLMLTRIVFGDESRLDTLSREIILVNEVTKSGNINRIIESVTYGDTILLVEGEPQALILNSKSFQLRNITEPASEQILSGPREGFNESILVNLSQIHRRIRSNDLKIKYYTFGRRTNTKACICYIDSLVNKEILDELYRRLDKIDIDGVLDSNYIVEIIKDAKWSPFRTVGMTERPDNVVGNLLEGKVALLVDGSPVAITVPFLFIENFQSKEINIRTKRQRYPAAFLSWVEYKSRNSLKLLIFCTILAMHNMYTRRSASIIFVERCLISQLLSSEWRW